MDWSSISPPPPFDGLDTESYEVGHSETAPRHTADETKWLWSLGAVARVQPQKPISVELNTFCVPFEVTGAAEDRFRQVQTEIQGKLKLGVAHSSRSTNAVTRHYPHVIWT